MKFSCGITLYNPKEKEIEFILKYSKAFDKIYLYDNTENNERLKNEIYFKNKKNFIYMSNGKNNGLAKAFNKICRKALEDKFDFICLLDQDSKFYEKDIINMVSHIKKFKNKDVIIYVPKILFGNKNKKSINSLEEEIEWEISSGTFLNLNNFLKVGNFDENYFIDRLDYDYCFKAREKGYKIMRVNTSSLYQTLGETKKVLFFNISQHSPLRNYYITRNRFYFYFKKNKISFRSLILVLGATTKQIINILFLEDDKKAKIKMIVSGIEDFKKNKIGKRIGVK